MDRKLNKVEAMEKLAKEFNKTVEQVNQTFSRFEKMGFNEEDVREMSKNVFIFQQMEDGLNFSDKIFNFN